MRSAYLPALFALFSPLAVAQDVSQVSAPFHNESEAGVVVTGGNSRSQSYSLKQMNSYEWVGNILKLNGRFLKTSSGGIESARSWSLGLRYERILTERLNTLLSQNVESDIFAGFLQRYNTDIGAKYFIHKQDPMEGLQWFVEGGYRYTSENRLVPPNANSNYVRLYTEANRGWNRTVTARLWIEYLPNITNFTDTQINTELSVSAIMTAVFSLKTSYLIKFDNLPATGAVYKTDSQLTTALVAKL